MRALYVVTPEAGCRPRFTAAVRIGAATEHELILRVLAHLRARRVLTTTDPVTPHHDGPGRLRFTQTTSDRTLTVAVTYRKDQA